MAPTKKRKKRGLSRVSALGLLLLLFALFLSWFFGWLDTEPGGGPEPTPAAMASLDDSAKRVQFLSVSTLPPPANAPREEDGSADEPDPAAEIPAWGAAYLSGHVVSDGEPVAWETVRLVRAVGVIPPDTTDLVAEARTDATGRFSMSVSPRGGPFRLRIRRPVPFYRKVELAPWSVVDVGTLETGSGSRRRISIEREDGDETKPRFCFVQPRGLHDVFEDPLSFIALDERLTAPHAADVRRLDGADECEPILLGDQAWEIVAWSEGCAPVVQPLGDETTTVVLTLARPERLTLEEPRAGALLVVDRFVLSPDSSGTIIFPAGDRRRLFLPGCYPRRVPAEQVAQGVPVQRVGWVSVPAPREDRLPDIDFERDKHEKRWSPLLSSPHRGARRNGSDEVLFPLEPGRWTARRPGFAPQNFMVTQGATERLGEGDAMPRVEGFVVDAASGEPFAGAAVMAAREIPTEWSRPAHRDATGAAGRFVLEGLIEGPLDILVTSPAHRPARIRLDVKPDVPSLTVTVPLPRGVEARVRVTTPGGAALSGQSVCAVDAQGRTHFATSDSGGVARFPSLAPGHYTFLILPGEVSVPLDSWEWLTTSSGGPSRSLEADAGDAVVIDWEVPAPRGYTFDVALANAPAAEVTLQVVHVGTPPAPGVWPNLRFEGVRAGRTKIDALFCGRYRALAIADDRVATCDFVLTPEGGPATLTFTFPEEN